jgi:hypothetical protein
VVIESVSEARVRPAAEGDVGAKRRAERDLEQVDPVVADVVPPLSQGAGDVPPPTKPLAPVTYTRIECIIAPCGSSRRGR